MVTHCHLPPLTQCAQVELDGKAGQRGFLSCNLTVCYSRQPTVVSKYHPQSYRLTLLSVFTLYVDQPAEFQLLVCHVIPWVWKLTTEEILLKCSTTHTQHTWWLTGSTVLAPKCNSQWESADHFDHVGFSINDNLPPLEKCVALSKLVFVGWRLLRTKWIRCFIRMFYTCEGLQ